MKVDPEKARLEEQVADLERRLRALEGVKDNGYTLYDVYVRQTRTYSTIIEVPNFFDVDLDSFVEHELDLPSLWDDEWLVEKQEIDIEEQ